MLAIAIASSKDEVIVAPEFLSARTQRDSQSGAQPSSWPLAPCAVKMPQTAICNGGIGSASGNKKLIKAL